MSKASSGKDSKGGMTTPYHARFFANELTRQGGEGVERLSRSLFDACVDLNPHQIGYIRGQGVKT